MQRILLGLFVALALASPIPAQEQPAIPPAKHTFAPPIHNEKSATVSPFNPAHLKFPRGLTPTTRHGLLAAPRFKMTVSGPAQVLMLPKQLSMWGNSQYGDCVSASEAAAIAAYSVYCGLPETFIPEANVISWAKRYGYLNGANLDEVMTQRAKNGMVASDGKTYTAGPYLAVDYSNESVLQAALAVGPVNVGMDANALPSGAGNNQGWYAFGGRPGQFSNEDHCCRLFGYGSTTVLFQEISQTYGVNVTPPANAPANGYLYFTWSTVGVVDHAWLMSTVGEAWVCNPTTVGQAPAPVPPTPPTPPTPPVPPAPGGDSVTITVTQNGKATTTVLPLASSGGILWPTDTPQWLKDAVAGQLKLELPRLEKPKVEIKVNPKPAPKPMPPVETKKEALPLGSGFWRAVVFAGRAIAFDRAARLYSCEVARDDLLPIPAFADR